jgi:hypothetical protein
MSTGLKRRFSDIDEDVAEVDSSALLLKTSSSAFISSAVPRKKKLEFPTVPHALISGSGASAKLVLSRDYIATKVRAWPRVRSTIQTLDGKMSLLRWEAPLESRRFDASGAQSTMAPTRPSLSQIPTSAFKMRIYHRLL